MSKQYPYFQFEPGRWMTGNIQFCSEAAKGYFIDIQCLYWQRDCQMTKSELDRKFTKSELINELIKEEVIKIKGEEVIIDFLIDQYAEIKRKSRVNSINGKKGAIVRNSKRAESSVVVSETKPVASAGVPNFFYVGTELYKFPVSKYVREELSIHTNAFLPTVKPVTLDQVVEKMDAIYCGATFSGHQHIMRAFDKIARDLKNGNTEPVKRAEMPQQVERD